MGTHNVDLLPFSIVLVTEARVRRDREPNARSRDLDMTTPGQAQKIHELLSQVVQDVILITDLSEFARQAPGLEKERTIVWPHWNGAEIRSRTSHAAALCEIYDLNYIGPDVYGRLISNDKSIAKVFIREAGLKTPDSLFIAGKSQTHLIEALSMPVIVKPNMEGSSIGIDDTSIARTIDEAKVICERCLEAFPDGVIVERFVSGPEIFIAIAFDEDDNMHWGCSERYVQEDSQYFLKRVYDYELKFTDKRKLALKPSALMTDSLLAKIRLLTDSIKTIDLIRVDGRLYDGEFYVIEITPDPLMTPDSEFLGSLTLAGYPPLSTLRHIVMRAATRRQGRLSSS